MTYRAKLTHDLSDVLSSLERSLSLYEQMATELATKQQVSSMDSRIKLLRAFTERIAEQVQLEILRKAGYGDVRVVRQGPRHPEALQGKHGGPIAEAVPVPQRSGSWSRRARPGVPRSA